MTTDVVLANPNLPAHLQVALADGEAFKEFAGGVQSGFPVISYRGKTWRVRQGGDEQVYVNDQEEAVQTVELVLIKSNTRPSKTYYEGKYKEGDTAKPQCWSADGIKPDPGVDNPVNPSCQSCPMNQWGSRITEQGNKTRACSDVRRVATSFKHELEAYDRGDKSFDEIPVMLLRIPPASLNPLKDYVEKMLKPKGLPPFVLSTKVGFDTDAAYPKLTFKGGTFLTEKEFSAVSDLRESDVVSRILNEAAEHVTEGTTGGGGDAASSVSTPKAEAPAPAPSEALNPNTEEAHFSEEIAQPVVQPQRAAAVEEEAAAEVVIEQPPKPVKKPVVAKSEEVVTSESPAGEPNFEDMLSSILD